MPVDSAEDTDGELKRKAQISDAISALGFDQDAPVMSKDTEKGQLVFWKSRGSPA